MGVQPPAGLFGARVQATVPPPHVLPDHGDTGHRELRLEPGPSAAWRNSRVHLSCSGGLLPKGPKGQALDPTLNGEKDKHEPVPECEGQWGRPWWWRPWGLSCPFSSSRAAGSVGSGGLGHRPSGSLCAETVEAKDCLGQSSLSCEKQKPHSHVLKPNGS